MYAFRGFAPTFPLALKLWRKYALPECDAFANSSSSSPRFDGNGSLARECAGPFPYAFGAFVGLSLQSRAWAGVDVLWLAPRRNTRSS